MSDFRVKRILKAVDEVHQQILRSPQRAREIRIRIGDKIISVGPFDVPNTQSIQSFARDSEELRPELLALLDSSCFSMIAVTTIRGKDRTCVMIAPREGR